MFKKVWRYFKRRQLAKAVRNGLQLGKDSQVLEPAGLGTEPFLISIGNHVSVAGGVRFITHDGSTWVYRVQEKYKGMVRYGRITIHDNCMIGQNAILLPGISIGPNAIVAAGAVVVQDVKPGTVVRGNPAREVAKVADLAELCFAESPDINMANYKLDKKAELLRLYPYPW